MDDSTNDWREQRRRERQQRRHMMQSWKAQARAGRQYGEHGGLIGGLILAGVGILLLLQNLGIPYFEDLWDYWPVILIVIGAVRVGTCRAFGGQFFGGIMIAVGMIFLAHNLGWIQVAIWHLIWPVLLILGGVAMLIRNLDGPGGHGFTGPWNTWNAENWQQNWQKKFDAEHFGGPAGSAPQSDSATEEKAGGEAGGAFSKKSPDGKMVEIWAVFGGSRRRVDTVDFAHAELFAMFGGVELDLRTANTSLDEVFVNANAIFGGIEIRVPLNWKVTVRGAGIFGGYEDKTLDAPMPAAGGKTVHLIVNGAAIFGGVTVQN